MTNKWAHQKFQWNLQWSEEEKVDDDDDDDDRSRINSRNQICGSYFRKSTLHAKVEPVNWEEKWPCKGKSETKLTEAKDNGNKREKRKLMQKREGKYSDLLMQIILKAYNLGNLWNTKINQLNWRISFQFVRIKVDFHCRGWRWKCLQRSCNKSITNITKFLLMFLNMKWHSLSQKGNTNSDGQLECKAKLTFFKTKNVSSACRCVHNNSNN